MNALAVERQATEVELRPAIFENELLVYYQPKVDLVTGTVTGAEALVRWIHPDKGILFPDAFILVAENSGLIVAIGKIVLLQACRQAKAWRDQGMASLTIAVNVSALEFRGRGYVENLRNVLDETGLDARCLQLEVTESVLMRNVQSSSAVLHELKQVGVQLAIDDFGTGYSSLSYRSQFPIDVLKIDQSFVQSISSNNGNGVIVNAVIGMGTSLGQRAVAEGVETPAQLSFHRAHHCTEGQGYLFSDPVSADDFTRLSRSGTVSAGVRLQ